MGILRRLDPGVLRVSQAHCSGRLGQGTCDRGLCLCPLQEAEQELLARVQSTLGLVARGYSVSLLLRGRETETPRLVPQVSPGGATKHRSHEAQVLFPPGDL